MAVTLDARREWRRQDAVGDFIQKTKCVTVTANGSKKAVTAGGISLGNADGVHGLQQILEQFAALPADQREPGRVKIASLDKVDQKRLTPTPPEGALVVHVWNRQLERTPEGKLRYTVESDYVESTCHGWQRYRAPADDSMWIPKAQWQALLPEDPRVGQTMPAPQSFALRLYRFHLDPMRGLSEGMRFTKSGPEVGEVKLTVVEVSPEKIRLRLDGYAQLSMEAVWDDGIPATYEPALLGELSFDRKKGRFTQFEIVALGELTGMPIGNSLADRPDGGNLLGVAFELIPDPQPGDLIPPRGGREQGTIGDYLYP